MARFGSDIGRSELERECDRLVTEHKGALSRLAGSYTRTASDREDLMQDIAMSLWQALPRFRGDCSERTFVFRVAHNRAITWLGRNPRISDPISEFEVPDPGPNPEASVVRGEDGERLLNAVRALPVAYRQVVVLALEELDYKEIAEVMGISESNVGVRLNRARQMLRSMLRGDE